MFDHGAARLDHETLWPERVQADFIALLMAAPPPRRANLQRQIAPWIEVETGAGRIPSRDRLAHMFAKAGFRVRETVV